MRSIKVAMEGLQAGRPESRAMVQYAEKLQKLWDNALVTAARNNRGVGTGRTQYSIRTMDGETMTVLDTENDTRSFDAAEKYLKALVDTEHPFATILSDAQPVYIGKDLPGEYRGSKYTQKMGEKLRTVKMQAATNLDEMLLLAENGEWRENMKEKHKVDARNGWYRYDARFAVPILNEKKTVDHYTVYGGTLLIRNDADGKSYLYDLVDIKKEKRIRASSFSAQGHSEVLTPKPSQTQYTQNANGSQVENSGGTKFSQRDSTGRELTEAQGEYFKDSKVRDEEGNLLVMYHQTDSEFTVFDTKHEGAGSGDNETPFGIFLKKTTRDIGIRGKKQMELYVDIQNPLRVETRSELVQKLEELSTEYADLKKQATQMDEEYGRRFEGAKRAFVDFLMQWRKDHPDAPGRAAYDAEGFDAAFNAEDEIVAEWTKAQDELALKAKEAATAALREHGYDGVFLERDQGSWGRSTEAYIALDAEQVKNTDNRTPTKDPDIRYSVREQFPAEVEQWDRDGRPEGERFMLGSTGPVLQGLGAIESDLYMEGDKISTILKDHPEMTLAEIKKIPQILEDPALVLKSKIRKSSIVVLGTYRAQNGKPILAAMDLRPTENGFAITDMQKVASAYTKTGSQYGTAEEVGRHFLETSDVLFLDKKRATAVLRPMGILAPMELLRNGYVGSISYKDGFVNSKGLPFSSVVKISEEATQADRTGVTVQNQQREPRMSDRDVLRMAAEMAKNDRSKRWSIEDRNRLEILENSMLRLDAEHAELTALEEERSALLAGRKRSELQGESKAELVKTEKRIKIAKDRIARLEQQALGLEGMF